MARLLRRGGLKSTKRATEDAFRGGKMEVPTDFGLAPNTLISPPKDALPAWARGTIMKRLKAEFYIKMLPLTDWARFFIVKRTYPSDRDPIKWWRQPYLLSERYSVARRLHTELFTAFAAGDKAAVSRLTCNGLNRVLTDAIDSRQRIKAEAPSWLVAYKGYTPLWDENSAKGLWPWIQQAFRPPSWKSTRIVSDKYMPVPLGAGTTAYIRQFVAEIRSRQRLETSEDVKLEDKVEYIVCQQSTVNGVVQPWKVWGTVKPSTKADVDEFLKTAGGATDKVKNTWTDKASQIMSGNAAL